mgnify:CR=1 FL=1
METKYKEKIGIGEKIAFMLGGMGGVPLFALISSFLVYFYTNVIGLDAGLIGGIILVSKIFDGVSDLIFGSIIDKTRTKYGVCRPWVEDCNIWSNWYFNFIYGTGSRYNRTVDLCVPEL